MTGTIRIFEKLLFIPKQGKLPDMTDWHKSSQVYNGSQALPLIVISHTNCSDHLKNGKEVCVAACLSIFFCLTEKKLSRWRRTKAKSYYGKNLKKICTSTDPVLTVDRQITTWLSEHHSDRI